MKSLAAILSIGMSIGLLAQSRRATYELDTLAFPSGAESPASSLAPGVVGISEGSPPPPRLKVTLESLSPTAADYLDRLIYDVLIENLDRRGVLIPWSPDARLIAQSPQGTAARRIRSGSIALIARDIRGKRLTDFAVQSLYGSEARGDSLQLLAPGETARIRASGEWRTSETGLNAVLYQPSGIVNVSALFTIDGIASVLSDNSIEAVLKGPRKE